MWTTGGATKWGGGKAGNCPIWAPGGLCWSSRSKSDLLRSCASCSPRSELLHEEPGGSAAHQAGKSCPSASPLPSALWVFLGQFLWRRNPREAALGEAHLITSNTWNGRGGQAAGWAVKARGKCPCPAWLVPTSHLLEISWLSHNLLLRWLLSFPLLS